LSLFPSLTTECEFLGIACDQCRKSKRGCERTSVRVIPGHQNPLERLHPSLSSWLKKLNKLSSLIDNLEELARAAPSDCRPQSYKQIDTLRMTLKSQRERCIHFLRLTEEYADRYLLDISAEIQQQSSYLDILERRLGRAKTLYRQVIDLRKSYEAETANVMKNVRKTGKAAFFSLRREIWY